MVVGWLCRGSDPPRVLSGFWGISSLAPIARRLPRPRRADAVAVQEQHDLADRLLLGPAGDDPLRPLRADPGYLAQARRLLLDHVEHGLTGGAHQLLGVNRADAANHAGPEIFFDALGRRGRHRLEERSPELNTVSAVVDPG